MGLQRAFVRTLVALWLLASSGCASSGRGPQGEPMYFIIGGQVLAEIRDGTARFRPYLVVPESPDEAPGVRSCGRYKETGSRITRDTCRSAGGLNSAAGLQVAQDALRWEQVANAALRRDLKGGKIAPRAEGERFALDITEELRREGTVLTR